MFREKSILVYGVLSLVALFERLMVFKTPPP
jgi:hypothetical protein